MAVCAQSGSAQQALTVLRARGCRSSVLEEATARVVLVSAQSVQLVASHHQGLRAAWSVQLGRSVQLGLPRRQHAGRASCVQQAPTAARHAQQGSTVL